MSNGDVPSCVKIKPGDKEVKCVMCFSSINDPVQYGELYECGNIVVHYFCLLFSSSLVQNGADNEGVLGFFPKDINKEIRRGARLRCSYCKKHGATIGCNVKACRKAFHLPCGLRNDSMHQFFNQFLSFCATHRPIQKVTEKFKKISEEDDDARTCPICYESVSNMVSSQTLWAPCCKKRWFHRFCLQRQALAQGYFFKCPTCNDIKKFSLEMKKFGIYIPEMDAAWEREPDAFQDLLISYKHCDAPMCKCEEEGGRNFSQNIGSWRLLRCNSCGSQGTHIACSALKLCAASNSWCCSLCTEVINKASGRCINKVSATQWPVVSSTSASLRLSPSSSSHSSSLRRPADVDPGIQANKKIKSTPPSSDQDSTYSSDDDIIEVCDESDVEVLDTSRRIITTNEGKEIKVHRVPAIPKEASRELIPSTSQQAAAAHFQFPGSHFPNHSLPVYYIPVNIDGHAALQPVVPISPFMSNATAGAVDIVCLD